MQDAGDGGVGCDGGCFAYGGGGHCGGGWEEGNSKISAKIDRMSVLRIAICVVFTTG